MFEAAVLLSHVKKLRTDRRRGGAAVGRRLHAVRRGRGGARGFAAGVLRERRRRKLKKVLPHFASQNNPLDVTGQAAVETEMYCGALEALANDPSVGLIAFDAFPPRLAGETPWADPVLAKAVELQRSDRGRVRERRDEPARLHPRGDRVHRDVEAAAVPAGPPRLGGRDPRARRVPAASNGRAIADAAAAPQPREGAPGAAGAKSGADRRGGRARSCSRSTASAARRSGPSRTPAQAAAFARTIGFPVAVKALAPEIPHKAKLGGVRLGLRNAGRCRGRRPPRCSRPRRGPAPALRRCWCSRW